MTLKQSELSLYPAGSVKDGGRTCSQPAKDDWEQRQLVEQFHPHERPDLYWKLVPQRPEQVHPTYYQVTTQGKKFIL